MTETASKDKTTQVLQAIYKNVKMASESIMNLLPKVNDERLKSNLTTQLSLYEAFASRAAKHLSEKNITPTEEGVVTRVSAKWGTMFNTMMDSSASHIAEMVIEGATMGVNDMFKQVREANGHEVPEDVITLAEDVRKYEEKTIEEMKEFLK